MQIIETKFDILCILTTLWQNIVMGNWVLDETHWVSDNICNIVNLSVQFFTTDDK